MNSRKLKWCSLFATLFVVFFAFSVAADELERRVAEVIGTFDENAVLHNATEKTYSLPDLGAFAAYYPERGELITGILVELHDKQRKRGLFNYFKYDLFIANHKLGIAVGRKLFPVVDITLSAVYTKDFEHGDYTWGFALGLIKF